MKELDKTKAYDLRDLNDEQLYKLIEKVKKDKHAIIFNDSIVYSKSLISKEHELSTDKFYETWGFYEKGYFNRKTINALTLFEPEVNIINQKSTDKILPKMTKKEPHHYDNSKGSLYQFCEDQKLNSYEFDIIKRVMRCRKKGNFTEDLEKTKFLIDLYLKEFNHEK